MANKWKAGNYKNSGMSKSEYEKKNGKKSSSSSSKKSSSNSSKQSKEDKKKTEEYTKKYYTEKKAQTQAEADTKTARLKTDLDNIYKDAGIAQTRAMQDYNTQIGNIESNRALDIGSINDYVTTGKTRTGEDLTTSLAKESRRYSLEYDKTNQNLADSGMTFSERTPEQIAKRENAQSKFDITTDTRRSFQDIARYEAAKTMDVQNKYGQQTEMATTSNTQTLEDILNAQNKVVQQNAYDVQDTATSLQNTLADLNYQQNDAISGIGNAYNQQSNNLNNTNQQIQAIGV